MFGSIPTSEAHSLKCSQVNQRGTANRKYLAMNNWHERIGTNPQVCHGKPCLRGTRIMVWQVLEMVAEGMSWEEIVRQWRGSISSEAIEEAVRLAGKAFDDHAVEYAVEAATA